MEDKLISRKINNTTTFDIKGFKHLVIGDPMYLENITSTKVTGCEKELVFDYVLKDASKYNGKCIIKDIEENYDTDYGKLDIQSIEILFYIQRDSKVADNIVNHFINDGKYVTSLLKKENTLGCDTASFDIYANDKYLHFNTGADGYYGNSFVFKNDEAIIISLVLDAGLFSMDEVVKDFKYLLG